MFNIREKFDSVFAVPKSWYVRVARFLNTLAQGTGIQISKPDNPSMESPVTIGIDTNWLSDYINKHGGDGITTVAEESVDEDHPHKHVIAIKEFEDDNGDVTITFQKLCFEKGILKRIEDFEGDTGTVVMFSSKV